VKYVSPAEALDGIEDASYDLALCTQVLHLIRHPEKALAEFARVLSASWSSPPVRMKSSPLT
jgi:ubiquinone/menaquinone biosynthesis C-methylase UbiE